MSGRLHSEPRVAPESPGDTETAKYLREYAVFSPFLAPVQMNIFVALRDKGRFLACLLFSCLALSACSTKSIYGVPESGELLQRIVSERNPPLLVRIWGQTPSDYRRETSGDPSAEAYGKLRDFMLFSGHFGGMLLMAVPSVLGYYGTYSSVERDNVAMKECLEQLDKRGQDVPELIHKVFLNEPTNSFLERELHSSFLKIGLLQPDTQVSVTDKEWRRTDFVDAQKDTYSHTLLVGDVRQKLEFGLSLTDRRCGLKLSFELDLNAIEVMATTERPLATEETIGVSNFLEAKDFQEFGANPVLLRAWVSTTVQTLAERIARLYVPK
jgi:hypothetical protein